MANLRLWMITAVLACMVLTTSAGSQVDDNDVDDNARAGKPPVTIPTQKVDGTPSVTAPPPGASDGANNDDNDDDDDEGPYVPNNGANAVNPQAAKSADSGVTDPSDEEDDKDDDVEEVVIDDQRLIILGH